MPMWDLKTQPTVVEKKDIISEDILLTLKTA